MYKRKVVVFYYGDKQLLCYSLQGEGEDEREETIQLLAYENDIPAEDISWVVETRYIGGYGI